MSTTRSWIGQRIDRAKSILADMHYVQTRMMEYRTGLPFLAPQQRRNALRTVQDLEFLYAYEPPPGR